jgi:hypothetical protein
MGWYQLAVVVVLALALGGCKKAATSNGGGGATGGPPIGPFGGDKGQGGPMAKFDIGPPLDLKKDIYGTWKGTDIAREDTIEFKEDGTFAAKPNTLPSYGGKFKVVGDKQLKLEVELSKEQGDTYQNTKAAFDKRPDKGGMVLVWPYPNLKAGHNSILIDAEIGELGLSFSGVGYHRMEKSDK